MNQPIQQLTTKQPTTQQPTIRTTRQSPPGTKRPTIIVMPTRSPIVPADPEYNKTFTVCEYTQLEAARAGHHRAAG
jgi:hypothetical protein